VVALGTIAHEVGDVHNIPRVVLCVHSQVGAAVLVVVVVFVAKLLLFRRQGIPGGTVSRARSWTIAAVSL
jgi:hypothetical protein